MTFTKTGEVCPCPAKKRFDTRKAAKQYKNQSAVHKKEKVRPYLCRCGWWHLGHLHPKAIAISRRYIYHKS